MTESRALESAGHPTRNQALMVAGWRWSSPVAALTLDRQCRDQSDESRAQATTPYHPHPGSTASPYLLVLLESCPIIQASVACATLLGLLWLLCLPVSSFLFGLGGWRLVGLSLAIGVKVSFAGSAWPGERTRVLPWLRLFLNRADLPSYVAGVCDRPFTTVNLEPRSCHVLSL